MQEHGTNRLILKLKGKLSLETLHNFIEFDQGGLSTRAGH
jgi:hypothetical protein